MSTHRVKQGECFASIASALGFHDIEKLYSHADNRELKSKRPNPNVLKPGDQVKIPDKAAKSEQGSDGATHRFKIKGLITHVRFLVEDFDGNALGGKDYELEIEGAKFEGKTGGDGLVEQKVNARATDGRLTVWLDAEKTKAVVWPLAIGALDPHDELSGVQARLNNLGFHCGSVDGINGPLTKAAVKAFNNKHGISGGDTVSSATRNKLRDLYGF